MKIDEPKTPYEYADDSSSSGGGAGGGAGGGIQEESEEEDEEGASGTRPGANSAARKPEELDAQLLSER